MIQNDSAASGQFPQTAWQNGERHLWNPIHRKALKNLPEERVRLRVLEYLMAGGWSKHRISTEEAIDLPQKEAKHRTDLICYTRDFNPFLLVECKAENVKLSSKTAEQIARYNRHVQAPFIMLTNGRTDYWYDLDQTAAVQPLDAIPEAFPEPQLPNSDFNYWKARGFAGKSTAPPLRSRLPDLIDNYFRKCDPGSTRYLSFKNNPTDACINHYYRIISFDDHRLALTFTATEFGSSRMICILNQEGTNQALLEINLDLLFDNRTPNAFIYKTGGPVNLHMRDHLDSFIQKDHNPTEIASELITLLKKTE